jgi:hypothetical protein
MPQPRKYANRADQQAAYRQRRTVSDQERLAQKGLPPLPAIPTMPGHARWNAMIAQAHLLLSAAVVEMQDYHDDRSQEWQDGSKADDLLAKLERLQETADQLQGIE